MIEFVDVRDKAEARYSTYEETVIKTAENGKKEFINKDFYIDIIWQNLRDDALEIRYVGVAWEACPTPHYNQTVYRYYHKSDDLTLLWTLPPEDDCLDMYKNRNVTEQWEWDLLRYVMSFYDGSLFNLVNQKELEDGTRSFS